jgi:hypothetical protein
VLRAADVPQDSRFESATQAAQRTGLYGKGDVEHRPITSAGYRTVDGGLLREQVHAAIRQLDAGSWTTRQFRDHMATLGLPSLPPAVERQLTRACPCMCPVLSPTHQPASVLSAARTCAALPCAPRRRHPGLLLGCHAVAGVRVQCMTATAELASRRWCAASRST